MRHANMATGLAARRRESVVSWGVFDVLARRLQRVRILGAAALDLCHVAAGSLEGYIETSIYVWDVAAGGLIVRRAGGTTEVLEDLGGNRMRFLATNGRIHAAARNGVLACLRKKNAPVLAA
jgi:myo-inositol-1(or 4)-monophosphatase